MTKAQRKRLSVQMKKAHAFAKKYGRPHGRKRTFNYKQARALYDDNYPVSDIAERFEVSTGTVYYALRIQKNGM